MANSKWTNIKTEVNISVKQRDWRQENVSKDINVAVNDQKAYNRVHWIFSTKEQQLLAENQRGLKPHKLEIDESRRINHQNERKHWKFQTPIRSITRIHSIVAKI